MRFRDPVPPEGERAEVTYTVTEGIARDLRQDDSARQPAHEAFHRGGPPREQGGLAFLSHEAPRDAAEPRAPRHLPEDRALDVSDRPGDDVAGGGRHRLRGAPVEPHVRDRRRVPAPGVRPRSLGAAFARRVVQQPLRARPRGQRGRAHLEHATRGSSCTARDRSLFGGKRPGLRGRLPDERLLLGHPREANGNVPSGGISPLDRAAHGPALPVRARRSELRPRARRGPAREPAEPHQLGRGRGDLGPARRPLEPALGHVPRRGRQVRVSLPRGGRGLRQGSCSRRRSIALTGRRGSSSRSAAASSGTARRVLRSCRRPRRARRTSSCPVPERSLRGRFVHPSRLSARQPRHPGGDPERRRRGRGRYRGAHRECRVAHPGRGRVRDGALFRHRPGVGRSEQRGIWDSSGPGSGSASTTRRRSVRSGSSTA